MPSGSNSVNFPPKHVFPHSPEIGKWISPAAVIDRNKEESTEIITHGDSMLSNKEGYLEFVIGPDGKRNIIRLSSSPYLNYDKYDWEKKSWIEPQIQLIIESGEENFQATDITNYAQPKVMALQVEATNLYIGLSFYYDGEKLITNYDFSNPEDRNKVEIHYNKLIDRLRVKAVLLSNSPGLIFSTPTIDQYTLVVGKQKVVG